MTAGMERHFGDGGIRGAGITSATFRARYVVLISNDTAAHVGKNAEAVRQTWSAD
jgi:hypothetical protein